MAIDWTTDPGGLFVRLGKWMYLIKENRTYQNTTLPAREQAITDQYYNPSTPLRHLDYLADQDLPAAFDQLQAGRDSITSTALANIRKTVMETMNAESVLSPKTDTEALDALIQEMTDDSKTVDARQPLFASAVVNANNVGDWRAVLTNLDYLGNNNDYVRVDTVLMKCTSEVTNSGIVNFTGDPVVSSSSSYLWQGGAGNGPNMALLTPIGNDGGGEVGVGGNALHNGDFEDFNAVDGNGNFIPTQWQQKGTLDGSVVAKETSSHYTGSSCVKFVYNVAATVAPGIKQVFNDSTNGTAGHPADRSVHCVGFWYKCSDAAMGAINLIVKVTLANATTGDAGGGTEFTKTISLAAAAPTTWTFANLNIAFDGLAVASGDMIEVYLDALLGVGKTVWVDQITLTKMHQHAGMHAAVFAGGTDAVLNDKIGFSITKAGSGEINFYLDMAYDLLGRGKTIPSNSAGGENILDSLIAT